ncbi:hypothetical protein SETIT_4G088900v2 [Setaria italica]|uniref:DUF3615 domain-containing protein n=1 Tax=Setaria italica TaxID=4555 RepID=A0A368QS94_SETIT|nr:hypothetical protein SETIT_4G088900v2 [Setaria italica]
MASTWSTGPYAPQTSPSVLDLLSELSAEEKARFPPQGRIPERQDVTTASLPTPIGPSTGERQWGEGRVSGGRGRASGGRRGWRRRAGGMSGRAARGAEFDAVKPVMEDSAHFRGKPWFHINFWARSRSSKNIKRFFAEVHYEARTDGQSFLWLKHAQSSVYEFFSQYVSSCALCRSHLEI